MRRARRWRDRGRPHPCHRRLDRAPDCRGLGLWPARKSAGMTRGERRAGVEPRLLFDRLYRADRAARSRRAASRRLALCLQRGQRLFRRRQGADRAVRAGPRHRLARLCATPGHKHVPRCRRIAAWRSRRCFRGGDPRASRHGGRCPASAGSDAQGGGARYAARCAR